MEPAPQDLDPEAIICPDHHEKYSSISLHPSAVKRLFCPDCLEENINISNLISLKKVISLSAITQIQDKHRQDKLERSEEAESVLRLALDEIDQTFAVYIEHVRTFQADIKQEITSLFKDKLPNSDILSQQQPDLRDRLKKTIASFNKDHKLKDGPELESYLETFNTLKNFEGPNNQADQGVLREKAKERIREVTALLNKQLESLKNIACGEQLIEKMKINPKVHSIDNAHANEINSLTVSLDGKWMVTASNNDWCIKVWDLPTRTLYHSFDQAHSSYIGPVEISRDCKQIVSGSNDRSIAFWSILDKKLIAKKAEVDKYFILSTKFSPDDQLIASAGSDIKIWRRSDLSLLNTRAKAHAGKGIDCVSFHPSGQYLLSGGNDMKISYWDLKKGLNNLFVLEAAHSKTITELCFNQKGEKFVSSSIDGSIKLWNFATRTVIHTIASAHGIGKAVGSICLVPEGSQILCSYGADGTARVWNITDNTHPHLLHTFPCLVQKFYMHCLAVSQNGKYLVVRKGEAGIKILEF